MSFYTYPASLREQLLWAPWTDMDLTHNRAVPLSSAETTRVDKVDEPAPQCLLLERSRTRLSTAGANAVPELATSDTSHTTPAPYTRLALKAACHLRDGVGLVLASPCPSQFWTAHVPVAMLQASLAAAYPSVQLPDRDVLAAVARAVEDHGPESLTLEAGVSQCATAQTAAMSTTRTQPRLAARTATARTEPEPCRGLWWLTLRSHVGVLRGYTVELNVRVACLPLEGCEACGYAVSPTTATPRWAERFFFDMIYVPQQARLLALSDALLHVCHQTQRSVVATVGSLAENYRDLSAMHVAQRSPLLEPIDTATTTTDVARADVVGTTLPDWEAERAASATTLQGCFASLEVPPPMRAVEPLVEALRRLARGDAADLIFAARPVDLVGRTPPTTHRAAAGAGPATACAGHGPRAKRARQSEEVAETWTAPQDSARDDAPTAPTASTTRAPPHAADASDMRKKKIRRLFS